MFNELHFHPTEDKIFIKGFVQSYKELLIGNVYEIHVPGVKKLVHVNVQVFDHPVPIGSEVEIRKKEGKNNWVGKIIAKKEAASQKEDEALDKRALELIYSGRMFIGISCRQSDDKYIVSLVNKEASATIGTVLCDNVKSGIMKLLAKHSA